MAQERIVVTGLGVMSPVGCEADIFFDNLYNGVSGISKVDRFDANPFKCQIAGQIRDFDPRAHYKSKKKIKQNDLNTHFAVAASHMALKDAGIDLASGLQMHCQLFLGPSRFKELNQICGCDYFHSQPAH